ncbi:MAG: hypothetical protein Q8N30_09550 [Methylococcales bacterium]|nr:hypothetical protein [Methylococcales bacterium]
MFTKRKYESLKIVGESFFNGLRPLFIPMALGLAVLGSPVAFADNAVKLKVLVVTTGDATQDIGLSYIQPILDEMGVRYDVLNAATQDLTAATLSPSGCVSATVGCVGNYNGVILTDSGMVGSLTPDEWDMLHAYETSFHVREAVLSGWPGPYWDPVSPWGVYLDYGLTYSSSPSTPYDAQWTVPAANSKTAFEYVNTANPLPITDFAFAATPRNDAAGPRDGTVPSVTPLLKTPAGDALVSIIQYKIPLQTTPVREVMLSTITNAWFLTHSQVLGYEFINWVTQGVFVGGRFVYMSNHLDDLFLANDLWDVNANQTNPLLTYRLTSSDISNAVSKQTDFRAAHPTAGTAFKLDFAFNGAGAVVDPLAATPVANLTEDLVQAVVANKAQFRFINHTFTHADMDKTPVPANPNCDYTTLTQSAIRTEITKNRTVWGLLGLPEQSANNRILVSGNHSGLKDRKCTDYPELHPEMDNVQSDDIPFVAGANPLFITAAASASVNYLASDTSQLNQDTEQYITNAMLNDGSSTDRLILPRYPANIFYNTRNPTELVSEYNYMFHDRFITLNQDPCTVAGAICVTRDYPAILAAEANSALLHMLSFKKYPHFFHQANVASYDATGNTLQFDWLNSVYATYDQLLKLPVKNLPYYQIGDMTKDSLTAKSATINATWDRTTNRVTVSANKTVPNLLITGLNGGELYGGQFIRAINVSTIPRTFTVNQALTQ